MKTKYDLYGDPGHCWLKVHLDELAGLDVLSKITSYSFVKGNFAYLEEDCDLDVFLKAKQTLHNVSPTFREHYTEKQSRIRNYSRYNYRYLS